LQYVAAAMFFLLTGLYAVLAFLDRASDIQQSELDEQDYLKQQEQRELQ